MADEDRAVLERLAALEAEVKSEADAKQARRDAALAKLRDQRVTQAASAPKRKPEPVREAAPDSALEDLEDLDGRRSISHRGADRLDDLGGALELASKANRVKHELTRPTKKGDKSWIVSGVASFALGPAGWLYAGSMREAIPAAAGYVALLALAAKILPTLFILPVFGIALPLSAIAGIVYALQYNRTGARQRLFDGDKKASPKQLRGE